ncbi:MAG: oxygen-independent coproporphyrinogen III oxidase [Paludibacter sp.]|nr:oxygen-independent coproporphyrinogen III oxidase [Paludibacter sp.]
MEINSVLIEKYNVPVPRYTSYPPANQFQSPFSELTYIRMIEESNTCLPENIAIYIHIPFCDKICFYCGCNTMLYKGEDLVRNYINALKTEIHLLAGKIDKKRKVSQIHYGGGTPNAIDVSYIEEINQMLFDVFDFIPQPEIAIECHPAHINELYLQRLLNARFNRFSFGIQDFNVEVLKTVNRDLPAMPVTEIVAFLKRENPSVSINLDFIYGLPGQTVASFNATMQEAIAIQPDRLVTFSYAHVPWLKKHQQILEKKGLLTSNMKMDIFLSSRELLLQSGYQSVGLDHYVLPSDELSIALNNNQLHRNFQGYCTRRTTGQVYAFGVSAISQFENGYFQNIKETTPYIDLLKQGKLPLEKGLVLTPEQKIIRAVIEQIMCNKMIDLPAFCDEQKIKFDDFIRITQFTEQKIETFLSDNLIEFENKTLIVTEVGSFFIRNIAASFDPTYHQQENQYSKSV